MVMTRKNDVEFDVSDKVFDSVAQVKIALREMAQKAVLFNPAVKPYSRAVDFNKAIYNHFLKMAYSTRHVSVLNNLFSVPVAGLSVQAGRLALPARLYGEVQRVATAPLKKPVLNNLFVFADKNNLEMKMGRAEKPAMLRPRHIVPALQVDKGISAVAKKSANGVSAIFRQSAKSMVLPIQFGFGGQLAGRELMKTTRLGAVTEGLLKFNSHSGNQAKYFKPQLLKQMPEDKIFMSAGFQPGVRKSLAARQPAQKFVEQAGTLLNKTQKSVGQGGGDEKLSNTHGGDLAASVVAALLAALTPALQASERRVEPMQVMMSPEDMLGNTAKYLTSLAGIQTGPTGFDYALSLAHPSGAYL